MTNPNLTPETAARYALDLARGCQNTGSMTGSAKLAADDAAYCLSRGNYRECADRALASLSYSVGIFSRTYANAAEAALAGFPRGC